MVRRPSSDHSAPVRSRPAVASTEPSGLKLTSLIAGRVRGERRAQRRRRRAVEQLGSSVGAPDRDLRGVGRELDAARDVVREREHRRDDVGSLRASTTSTGPGVDPIASSEPSRESASAVTSPASRPSRVAGCERRADRPLAWRRPRPGPSRRADGSASRRRVVAHRESSIADVRVGELPHAVAAATCRVSQMTAVVGGFSVRRGDAALRDEQSCRPRLQRRGAQRARRAREEAREATRRDVPDLHAGLVSSARSTRHAAPPASGRRG